MNDNISELFDDELENINYLCQHSIEYGVLTEDGNKLITIDVEDVDGIVKTQSMTVGDVMYFTEYGTIKFPSRNILQKASAQINSMVNLFLDNTIYEILSNKISKNEIDSKYNELSIRIENYLKSLYASEIGNINNISSIIGSDEKNQYFYDLKSLSKYIKCRIKKK